MRKLGLIAGIVAMAATPAAAAAQSLWITSISAHFLVPILAPVGRSGAINDIMNWLGSLFG